VIAARSQGSLKLPFACAGEGATAVTAGVPTGCLTATRVAGGMAAAGTVAFGRTVGKPRF
jgi:hypothetical protein